MLKKLLNKRILTGFQILIAILANGYVVMKFLSRGKGLFDYSFGWPWYFVFALLLMPVNYFMEAKKWQVLLAPQRKVDFWESLFIVLRSIPYGILTPWRVGEWYGRAEMERKKFESSVLAALGGYIQQLVTVSFGVLGVMGIFGFVKGITVWFVALLMVLAGYFLVKKAYLVWPRFRFLRNLDIRLYVHASFWAVLRYLVFSLQYVFVLKFVGVQAGFLYLLFSVAVIYLVVNVLPLDVFSGFGVRSSAAVFLLQNSGNVLAISLAGLLVWGINVGLSTVSGSLLIFRGVFARKQI